MSMVKRIQKTDLKVLDWTYTHMRTRVGNIFMPIVTTSGNFGFVWFVITGILFFTKFSPRAAYTTFWSLFFSAIFGNLIIKNVVKRPRPFSLRLSYDTIIEHPVDYSFPSGHAYSSFAAATAICFFLPSFGIGALFLACLISFSRIYLCVHYLSDVLCSVFFGIGTAVAVNLFLNMSLLR